MTDEDEYKQQLNRIRAVDDDRYTDIRLAIQDAGAAYPYTPYGATKTAELNVQFSIDPSYGLTRERHGWYSNGVLFDSTHFSQQTGKIAIETGANAGDQARLRSAYPGQYLSHSIAEPGVGARISADNLEYDENNHVSLTHGEISFEVSQFSDSLDTGITAHGISYEPDGAYHQVRSEDTDVAFVHQRDWNIDPMDGTGPSGEVLRPEEGYIYQFIYSWYGEGAYILAIQDSRSQGIIPLHRYPAIGRVNKSLDAPNMPVNVFVENKGTADPLKVVVGGMQFSTYGYAEEDLSRNTKETRHTTGSYIDTEAVLRDNAIDAFAEPGVPLISVRRDVTDIRARKGLRFDIDNIFVSADQDLYLLVFDEYHDDTALTNATFDGPAPRRAEESRLQTDTVATDYTPSDDAVLRGLSYVSTAQKTVRTITGDATSRVPLEATAVVTALLAPNSNATDAQPAIVTARERY